MKQYFYYAALILIPLALGGYLLYAFGRNMITILDDWLHGRELVDLRAESEAKRKQRQAEEKARLDNGCEHDFDTPVFGLPPGVCGKCGLAKQRPDGDCDHIWKLAEKGAAADSRCEKCGETFSVLCEQSLADSVKMDNGQPS
jgi:hypothetical protein